jgi:hypothetical protein
VPGESSPSRLRAPRYCLRYVTGWAAPAHACSGSALCLIWTARCTNSTVGALLLLTPCYAFGRPPTDGRTYVRYHTTRRVAIHSSAFRRPSLHSAQSTSSLAAKRQPLYSHHNTKVAQEAARTPTEVLHSVRRKNVLDSVNYLLGGEARASATRDDFERYMEPRDSNACCPAVIPQTETSRLRPRVGLHFGRSSVIRAVRCREVSSCRDDNSFRGDRRSTLPY